MTTPKGEIFDVTDTALWVAAYRAEESIKKDALFRDPYAAILLGETGAQIATRTQGSRYTSWSVIIRTYIIDQFIEELIAKGCDTVLNLGAGLDTRPYRLNLPADLRWIEVDFPKINELKNEKLKDQKTKCQLERIDLDLSDTVLRKELFDKVATESKKVLVLTEGVVPYLSDDEALSLAQSLHSYQNFSYWITEYYSPEILKFLRTPKRLKQMQNAPFLFYPEDWFGFFKKSGWNELETKYFGVESEKLGRTPPTPGWIKTDDESTLEKTELIKFYLGYTTYIRSN